VRGGGAGMDGFRRGGLHPLTGHQPSAVGGGEEAEDREAHGDHHHPQHLPQGE